MLSFDDFRDQVILDLGVEIYPHADHSFIDTLDRIPAPDPDGGIAYPIVLFDHFRREYEISEYYIDPVQSNELINTSFYLRCWIPFVYLVIDKGSETGEVYWVRAVKSYAEKHGYVAALSFIRRLWKNRWINSFEFCSKLVVYCKAGIITSNGEASSVDYWLDEAYELRKSISRTKDTVKDLTEWFEALFVFLPEVVAAQSTLMHPDEESNKYFRFFSEARADILTTYFMISSVLQKYKSHPLSRQYLPLSYLSLKNPDDIDGALKSIETEILHRYRGRVILPKFWYEIAKDNLQTKIDDLPIELDTYSVRSFAARGYFLRR